MIQYLPMLLQAGMSAGQLAYGLSHMNTERPDFDIPEAQEEALALQRAYSNQKMMPAQTIAQENIYQNQANVMSAMKEQGVSSPAALAALQESTNESLEGLGYTAAQWRTGEKDKYLGQLGNMAQWENMKWQWEEAQPYEEETAAASAMLGAGMQNMLGASTSWADVEGAKEYREWMKKMLGGSNASDTTKPTSDSQGSSFGGDVQSFYNPNWGFRSNYPDYLKYF